MSLVQYYNHSFSLAGSRWERSQFLADWWRLGVADRRWVPPYFPVLRRELDPLRNAHLARLAPALIYAEALPRLVDAGGRARRSRQDPFSPASSGPLFEEPVAAVVALCDPRRRDRTGYLALLHCANDLPTLRRTVDRALEALASAGCRQVIGPTGLSPHLDSGLLEDSWDLLPPLHTPYNPPYLPELIDTVMRPISASRLYRLAVPGDLLLEAERAAMPAEIVPLEPARLAADLLSLLAAACPPVAGFPEPDAEEAAFLLRWLGPWPPVGYLAEVDGRPAGFVLLQGDFAPRLWEASGGRQLTWRLWLARAIRRPARSGRLLFGGVLPVWRGQGLGRRLLDVALAEAQRQGWHSLNVGPLPHDSPGSEFLLHHGAEAGQTYQLYGIKD